MLTCVWMLLQSGTDWHLLLSQSMMVWLSDGGALALRDRIKSLIIRLHCVIVHSLRHDLIPVLGLARTLQSQHMLLPALPRWASKSNREPFGAIKPWLIGEKEASGWLISPIFISPPTHHINLPCWVYFHLQSLYLWLIFLWFKPFLP